MKFETIITVFFLSEYVENCVYFLQSSVLKSTEKKLQCFFKKIGDYINNIFDWPMCMISGSNKQLKQELEYTPLKPECHSWRISKTQSDTLEERYAIKLCLKLGKNAAKTYGILQTAFGEFCMNRASVIEWHKRFKEGRVSVRDDERCGRSKEVNTPELTGQRVRVRVTILRF